MPLLITRGRERSMSDAMHEQPTERPSGSPTDGEFWEKVLDNAIEEQPAKGEEPEPEPMAISAVAEIDKLMGDLISARDYLMAEAEKIRRDTLRLKALSKSAVASVQVISDNLAKWRENNKEAA
jgi:hypothetical protein